MRFLLVLVFLVGSLMAGSFSYNEHAIVISSEPIYKTKMERVPIRDCYDVGEQPTTRRDTNSIGIDTAIGAIIGVAIGNQIGHGNGRDAAKIAGGLGGAYIANNQFRGNSRDSNGYTQECTTTYTTKRIEYITHFVLTINYKGKRLTTKSNIHRDSGERIPVKVTVRY